MSRQTTRLLFLIDSMQSRGGMERVTASIASGLARRGLDVRILTLRGNSSAFPLDPGIKLTSLGMPPGSLRMRSETLPLIRNLRKQFIGQQPDLLITVDTFLSVFAFPAALGLKIRRLAWEHFNFRTNLNMRSRTLGRRVAAQLGEQVVTLTRQDADHWRQAIPSARAHIQAIPNPLPFEPLPENPYRPEHSTVLALGRLDDQKGFDLLLKAWSRVEAQHPEWSLKILGQGEREQALREQAALLNLQRFMLANATSQVEQEYRAAGLYVLSSRHEGLPMVLLESQAYGVPAVAFDCPTGPAEVLEPGGGLLVEAEHVEGLAAALGQLMSSPEMRQTMSRHAFEHASRYEPDHILNQWVELIRAPRSKNSTTFKLGGPLAEGH